MPDRARDDIHRILRLFGDVLPGSTADDCWEHGSSSPDEADSTDSVDPRDRWLRDNRPPHHNGPR